MASGGLTLSGMADQLCVTVFGLGHTKRTRPTPSTPVSTTGSPKFTIRMGTVTVTNPPPTTPLTLIARVGEGHSRVRPRNLPCICVERVAACASGNEVNV